MGDAEPDWYPDPRKTAGVFRWWTGAEWTDLLAADPDAPPPAPEEIERSITPSGGGRAGHTVRNAALTVLVLVLVLGGLAGLGFRADDSRPYPEAAPTDFGSPRTPAPPVPDLLVDEKQNTVTLAGQLSATMPAAPWDTSIEYPFAFGTSGATRVAVHEEYWRDENWYGIVTLGTLDRPISRMPDFEATARAVLDSALSDATFFHSPPYQPEEVDFRSVEVPGEPDLHRYDVSFPVDERGLASTSDDLVIILADLGEDRVGAWVEMLPNDIDPELRAAVEESRASLTLE